MSSRKRTFASRTGPASYKRAKLSTAKSIQKGSTIRAPPRRRVELKRVHDELAFLSVSTTGQVEELPLIGGGSESSQRDGRAVVVKGWEIRGVCAAPTTSGGTIVRVIVFKWKQSNGGAPTIFDILSDNGPSAATINASYNISQASNYNILSDRVYNTGVRTVSIGGTAYEPYQQYIHAYGKADFIQTYQSNTAAQVVDQQLYVLAVCEAPTTVLMSASVTFVDI